MTVDDEDEAPGNVITPYLRARARGIGRPSVSTDIRVIAQEYSEPVMRAMAEIALDQDEKAQSRVAAAGLVLGYGHGRPSGMTDEDDSGQRQDPQAFDISRLSPEDQRAMFELVRKARGE